MKVTVVPAQVTTVEDRIIGNIGFSQMMLLIVPVFLGAALFAGLPPAMAGSGYKYAILGALVVICSALAIRVKGTVVAFLLITILRYNLRPKYYLFNKNTSIYREQYPHTVIVDEQADNVERSKVPSSLPKLEFRDAMMAYTTIENPAAKLRFETTKNGGLHVRLAEIEE